jgi:hypothetical protein
MWWGRVWLYSLPLLFRILLNSAFSFMVHVSIPYIFFDVLLVGSEIDF